MGTQVDTDQGSSLRPDHGPGGVGSSARRRLDRFARAGMVVLRDPSEGVERVREKIANESERWIRRDPLTADRNWEVSLHAQMQVQWPCEAAETFTTLWAEIVASMHERGLQIGRGTFSGWDDADPAFACAAWCVARHCKPVTAVETGVARGFTTRVTLEALETNGVGHLSSIDLPPPLDQTRLDVEIGAAVTDALKGRWTLIEGSSRRRLPGLLQELGTIDMFVHDSRHTRRNILFELQQAWAVIRPGGFLLADDVHGNAGFQDAVRAFGRPPSIVCASDDGRGMFGIIRKPE
jgi:Methyltransferase domain